MDIITILEDRGIEYRKTNDPNRILIRCTSGEHQDKNPSLSYHLEKNVFKCWSCDFKGGSGKFLQSIGITTRVPVETKQSFKVEKLRQRITSIIERDNVRMPSVIRAVDFPFKGIDESVLREFEAFTAEELGLEDYICFPVTQFGRLKFIEGRLRNTQVSKRPKYYRRPAGASASKVMFPLDKITKTNHVILVEGIFDMLNLWQHGVKNALCIFGTQNFGQAKINLLDQIGVTRVSLLMDGDSAGTRAASNIQKMLEQNNLETEIITLPPGKDPGDLDKYETELYLK